MGKAILCNFVILESKITKLKNIVVEMEGYLTKAEGIKIPESSGRAAEALNLLNDEIKLNIKSRIEMMGVLTEYLIAVRDGFTESEKAIQTAIAGS